MLQQVESAFFDTPMGRFGVMISFDLLYGTPSLALLNKHRVDHVLFPAAWVDKKPLFHALSFHSGYAVGHGVNLLAANLFQPSRGWDDVILMVIYKQFKSNVELKKYASFVFWTKSFFKFDLTLERRKVSKNVDPWEIVPVNIFIQLNDHKFKITFEERKILNTCARK